MPSSDTLFCSWCVWFLLIPTTFIVAVCVPWSTVEVRDLIVRYDDYGEILPKHPSVTIECRSGHIQIDGEKIKYSKIIEDWKGKQCVPDELLPMMEGQDWYKPEEGTCDFTYHRRAKRTMVAFFILSIIFVIFLVNGISSFGDAFAMASQVCVAPFMMIIFAVVIPFPFSDNMCGKTAHPTTDYIALMCLIGLLIVWPLFTCCLMYMIPAQNVEGQRETNEAQNGIIEDEDPREANDDDKNMIIDDESAIAS